MPTDTEIRDHRQQEILAILQEQRVGSQGELVEMLGQRGISATQSSVSRDLRDLGIARVAGRYVAPPAGEAQDPDFHEAVHFLRGLKPAGAHLLVVFTSVGAAQTVALAIDHAAWPEVVGTMAGDDTIFVATAGARDQKRLIQRLERLLEER
jgi:transcriptional regulator of arginine metabolism